MITLPQATPGIQTFAADCQTPKTDFKLGDTVCAQATGLIGFRFAWVDAAGFIVQRTAITSDPQTDTFTLPSEETSVIGGIFTVDNRGTWQANVITSRGSVRARSLFNVTSNNAVVDLSILKTRLGDAPSAGGPVQFTVTITNAGPNDATNVHFVDSDFTNATFNSVTQTSGPAFTCAGGSTADCTIATLPNGSVATFTLNFTAGSAGGNLVNTATVSSDTTELNPADNSSSPAPIIVASSGTPPSCVVSCPDNITVVSDGTIVNGQVGAYVNYPDPTTSGSCDTVVTSQPSGSFFPVGSTVVTVTSADGSCSFTVMVTAPVTISCPENKTAVAGPNCNANVTLGTPTATGSNVTVTSSRSDGLPLSDPYALGITTVTWTATAHSALPATDDNATGSVSCQQTVTVQDKTAPTINVTPQTVPADASCQGLVPNYFASGAATASDNCTDPATITVTQDVAPGTTLGLGPHTITLTATDESGNTSTQTTTLTVADVTPPSISCPSNITAYLPLHTTATSMAISFPAATATDNCSVPSISYTIPSGSGPVTITSGYSFPVGTTPVTATATDASGNSASCTFTVTVLYDFSGFFSPISNLPVLNAVNAGRAIPVKFSLSGNKGLNIFAANNPVSIGINCTTDQAIDVTQTTTAGNSSLSYDASSDQYNYVWKTDSSWAGTCRQLSVTLNDGTTHVANFKFK